MEYYAGLYIASRLVDSPAVGRSILSRPFGHEVLQFLGDVAVSFYPVALERLEHLANTTSTGIIDVNVLNALNYARRPWLSIVGRALSVLRYVNFGCQPITVSQCDIDLLDFDRVHVQSYTLTETDVQQFDCAQSVVHALSLTASQVQLRCNESTVDVVADGSQIALNLSETVWQGHVTNSSLTFDFCRNVSFLNLHHADTVCIGTNDAGFFGRAEHVTFDRCVFLHVPFGWDFLRTARFKACVFVACELEQYGQSHDLDLPGCLGSFESDDVRRKVQIKDGPVIYMAGYSRALLKRFARQSPADRLNSLRQMSSVDALTVACESFHRTAWRTITPRAVRERIRIFCDKRRTLTASALASWPGSPTDA